jgi:hypothetical protein
VRAIEDAFKPQFGQWPDADLANAALRDGRNGDPDVLPIKIVNLASDEARDPRCGSAGDWAVS